MESKVMSGCERRRHRLTWIADSWENLKLLGRLIIQWKPRAVFSWPRVIHLVTRLDVSRPRSSRSTVAARRSTISREEKKFKFQMCWFKWKNKIDKSWVDLKQWKYQQACRLVSRPTSSRINQTMGRYYCAFRLSTAVQVGGRLDGWTVGWLASDLGSAQLVSFFSFSFHYLPLA